MPGYNVIDLLRLDLKFPELGLYRAPTPGPPVLIFADSPAPKATQLVPAREAPMTTLAEVPQQQIPPQQATVSFKNILLATDFSDASEKAFHYATAIARLHGSKIYVVHVRTSGDYLLHSRVPRRPAAARGKERGWKPWPVEASSTRSHMKPCSDQARFGVCFRL